MTAWKRPAAQVRYPPKGCPRRIDVAAPEDGIVDLTARVRRARLKPGARLVITVTKGQGTTRPPLRLRIGRPGRVTPF
jgi:hypothetical protein